MKRKLAICTYLTLGRIERRRVRMLIGRRLEAEHPNPRLLIAKSVFPNFVS